MQLKYKGTIAELKQKFKPLGGLFDFTQPNRVVYGTASGVIINWYQSTGTLQFQGVPSKIDEIKEQVILLLNLTESEPVHTHTDSRSESGITVGLIESLISIARVLKSRLTTIEDESIIEALNDFQNDEDVKYVLSRSKTII